MLDKFLPNIRGCTIKDCNTNIVRLSLHRFVLGLIVSQPGDLMHFSAAGQHIIVLGSYQATMDLLHRRGTIYSDRPRMVMLGELYVYVS